MQTIKLSDFKKAIDDYINTYGDGDFYIAPYKDEDDLVEIWES